MLWNTSQTNESIHRQGRTGGHPKGREYFWVCFEKRRGYVCEVLGCFQRVFDFLGRLNPGRAEGFWRKLYEPRVIHIDGAGDIGLPDIGIVAVNSHGVPVSCLAVRIMRAGTVPTFPYKAY